VSKIPLQTKAGFDWLLKMAWRDGKASGKRLFLFMASIVLGIAAVVSIQSFSENLQDNIALQSKALMGADFIIDSNQLPNERVQTIIDSLGGSDAQEVSFPSMAAFPKADASKLVSIRGITQKFPFYGELETDPPSAAESYYKNKNALVDGTLMMQYGLKAGDSVKVGERTFAIEGILQSVPGSSAISASVAPTILLPYEVIEGTGLLQVGSRLDYNYYFVNSSKMDLEELDKSLDPILDAENADLDTHLSTSQRLGRTYENFGRFLNLVAFIALLLGCVGIASSVHIYIKEKLPAIAVLKCIGATRNQTFLIYLIQIAGMGLVGGFIGTVLGLLLQQSFPLLLQDFLPFTVELSITIKPILTGMLLGVSMSVLFALLPLLSTWHVSPLEVLRVQETPLTTRTTSISIGLGILLFIYGFAYWLLRDWRFAAGFVLGIVVTFSILAGFANLLMKAIKRFFPSSWGFISRQSLLNLFRPNNQTVVLVLAIGVGSFLISTLYFTKDMLLTKAQLDSNATNPNVILMDVQTNQKEDVINTFKNKDLEVLDNVPIITMRVASIKGVSANTIRQDTTSRIKNWILNHEFRATYRDQLMLTESVTSGEFVPQMPTDGLIPISLSNNVAWDAQVKVGDTLAFNIQGVLMQTVVSSIREIDWGQMRMNFNIIFPKGVLENAPQFHVLSTNSPDAKTSANLQRELVREFPNVSVIDLRQVLVLIQGILDKISWVINFMAFFSILTGIIVLIGSVRTSKYQRIKESVLLRTLGAKGSQILKITALEYLYLGVLGTGIGILLSVISSQLLARLVFDVSFVPSWIPFVILLPGITILTLLIGLGNSRSVLHSPPLEVLRKES
jgi:putative ABC transport system permease protein